MAIFKYKKPNGSGGYSIKEMPVISNTYTEYVVQDATDGTRTITLTPTKTSDSTGPGAFEDVIANVKLLSSNPTYDPMTSLQTITYGSDGFPAGITISAIPTTTKTYTSSGSKQEYNFNTSTGFPTKVTINAMPTSTPPADLQITTPSETITIPAGYYSNDIIISSNINNRGNIKDQTQIKPSNYSSTYYNTGYYTGGTTNGKVNIATGAITLTANSPNGTPYTYSDWGNVFPTSITVAVPSDLPQVATPPSVTTITTQNGSIKIDAGYYTSDITISASLPTSTVPSDTTISTPSETVTIPAGYLSNAITINSNITNRGAPGNQSLKPQTKTSYTVSNGYYSTGFTVSPSTQVLTSTNPSLTYNSSSTYYEKTYTSSTSTASSTVWGDNYLTQLTLRFTNKSPSSNQSLTPSSSSYTIPTGYHATSNRTVSVYSGSKSITSNGTYYATNDGYFYSSVTVNVSNSIPSGYQNTSDATEDPDGAYILSGYKLYKKSGYVTGSMSTGSWWDPIVKPSTINTQYSAKYVTADKLDIRTTSLTLTDNGTYTPNNTVNGIAWGDQFATSITVNVPTGYTAYDGILPITTNGIHSVVGSDGFYPSVNVQVPSGETYAEGTFTGVQGYTMKWERHGSVLIIRGYDTMPDFSSQPPWADSDDSITKVIISEGVRGIGNNAFYWNEGIQEITIGSTVSKIGNNAFTDIGRYNGTQQTIRQICIPNGVNNIYATAFNRVSVNRLIILSADYSNFTSNCFSGLTVTGLVAFPWANSNTNTYGLTLESGVPVYYNTKVSIYSCYSGSYNSNW